MKSSPSHIRFALTLSSHSLFDHYHELDPQLLSDQELVTAYKEQGGVERGFRRSRKIPCFWLPRSQSRNQSASSRFRLVMVLCLLVYRLAEYRLRARLTETEQTIPDQIHKPTARPTMRLSSFNALKGLSCCMYTRPLPHSSLFYVCSLSIGSFCSS
jgi:transposase